MGIKGKKREGKKKSKAAGGVREEWTANRQITDSQEFRK